MVAYGCFVFVWFVSNRLVQDSWWGIVILDRFAEYYLLPAIVVLMLSLFSKKRSITLVALVPVLICAYFYWPFLVPAKRVIEVSDVARFRVATFNIWNHNDDIERVVSVINETYSDVIALQEITEDQRSKIIDGLRQTYPYYHVSKPVYGGTTAIFSRYPLSNLREIDIQIDRPSIIASLVWRAEKITIISAHLNPSFWAYWRQPLSQIPRNYHKYIIDQNKQANAIIESLENYSDTDATFLACDCNSQETASTNRLLSAHFEETLKSIGLQLGETGSANFRFERKLTHIDYIWYAGSAKPKAIYRGRQTAGSDHEPLFADYVF